MCGICGVTYFDRGRPVTEPLVRRMCDVIRHRGPDDQGQFVRGNVGLGMRRLSIIDLVTGRQPIANEDDSTWIVFNGEIYNHLELRRDLEKKGHRFKTKSDTEAILHAYEEYGEACPTKLNGMFAFAIWDGNKQRLFLARDRLGIKPLYYYHDGEKFAFGSELKSILQVPDVPREVSPEALDLFLTFEYIPAPLSIFKGIAKLPAGHALTLREGRVQTRAYWDLRFAEREVSEAEACEELRALLQDAVKIRLMSDVPLGAFLSGGIDSSSVVAMMSRVMDRPVKTFSIAFKEATYNEAGYARLVADHFKTEHHEFTIETDALGLTEKLIAHLDEPLGDFSIFPTFLVSQMARDYVTVALSGDGGDELFAGYDTYMAHQAATAYERIPGFARRSLIESFVNRMPPTEKKKGLINRAKRFVEGMQLPADLGHTRWMVFLQEATKARLYSSELRAQLRDFDSFEFIRRHFRQADTDDLLNRQLYVDVKTYLVDDILVKVDRMSMATSLEARVPLLDHRFVELAATLPGRLKLNGRQTKYIFKKAMQPLLPPEILTRGKEGFSIPIKNWLKHELKDRMLDVLSPERVQRDGFFNPEYMDRLVREHLNGRENHSHRLWAMMVFGIWQELYLEREENNHAQAFQTSRQFAAV